MAGKLTLVVLIILAGCAAPRSCNMRDMTVEQIERALVKGC